MTSAKKQSPHYVAAKKSWEGMLQRCNNPNNKKYYRYGARGITVSWESFEEFYRDMGERPEGMVIDRIDNNKGYEKDNCRWTDARQSAQNQSHSKWWVIDGERYPSSTVAAEALGITRCQVKRVCKGRKENGKFYPPKPGCYTELKDEDKADTISKDLMMELLKFAPCKAFCKGSDIPK